MKLYDITLTLSESLAVWPGDPAPKFERKLKIEKGDVANVTIMTLGAHTGTHVDAPYHFIHGGKTVESLPLDVLVGDALVVERKECDALTAKVLQEADIPEGTKRLLIKTRNSDWWEKNSSKFYDDYVPITEDGAQYLVGKGIRLIGVDYLSVSPFDDPVPTHEAFLKSSVVILEGVDLSKIIPGNYTLCCLPLKVADADGAPCRAILMKG